MNSRDEKLAWGLLCLNGMEDGEMTTFDVIALAAWARGEIQDAEEKGDSVSVVDALRRVKAVLVELDLTVTD